MVIKAPAELERLVEAIFLGVGATPDNARLTAEHLVRANLSGVDSHGVWHVLGYVQQIKDGQVDPAAAPQVIQESGASTLVSGHWTFGQVGALYALDRTIEKAKSQGVAIGGLVQSYHIGRLGHYVERAAEEGLVSMIYLGGQGTENPTAVPYGGRQKVLHTNPLAMGFPGAAGEPAMMFDFATTPIAGVKVVNAHNRGEQVPPNCLVDAQGRPTRDPGAYFAGGGHLPFGQHKGYAIMMAVEYLGRVLLGSEGYAEEGRGWLYDRYGGTCMVLLKADLFQAMDEFTRRAEGLADKVRTSAPAPNFERVLVPGDLERRARHQRRDGIPIEDDVWRTLGEAAELAGVEI